MCLNGEEKWQWLLHLRDVQRGRGSYTKGGGENHEGEGTRDTEGAEGPWKKTWMREKKEKMALISKFDQVERAREIKKNEEHIEKEKEKMKRKDRRGGKDQEKTGGITKMLVGTKTWNAG